MTVAEYIQTYGTSPEFRRGRWVPWTKEGRWLLTSLQREVHVLLWDSVSGQAVVLVGDRPTFVRVENLRRYRRLTDLGSSATEKSHNNNNKTKLPETLEELLQALGI